jgi:signal transduction histidine kinase
VLTAAVPLHEVDSALRQLAIVLSGLSAGTWLLAAVLGQWLCRRAIRPITGMASAARAMGAADHAERLPVAATHDELEELGRSFNDLLGRLHESFERQRRFTGEAAHQLRTPLTAILGQVDVTLRRSRTADEYREIISKVHSQAIHLRQLVEMLLFLARADAEAMLPDLETINLAAWLPDHLRGWSGHARAADLHFSAVPNGSTRVRAHGPLLGQLLDNLLDNACNYSPPGTPITIRLRAEPSQQIVDVEDIGPGIATEDLPHVFEPFFRASQTRHSVPRGIGLGLSVAQRIAGAFNGGVLVAANEPRGTRFTIRLPSAPADKEASQNKGRPE